MLDAVLTIAALQTWSMPAQAVWPAGAAPTFTVTLRSDGRPISMSRDAEFNVELNAVGDGLRVSGHLAATRGISLQVRDSQDRIAAALEPIRGSPPPPPLDDAKLKPVGPGSPLATAVREPARWIFPGPGSYRVRVVVTLTNFSAPTPPAAVSSDHAEVSDWLPVQVVE